jgi:hypothetical protein
MKRFLVAAVTALTACSGLVISTAASAAPAMPCAPASVTPHAASIPANLPAFGYTAVNATANDIHLVTKSGTPGEIALTLGRTVDGYLEVKPSTPLTPGTAYELQFQAFCSYGAYPAEPLAFVAAPEAPLPTKLGDVASAPTVSLKDYGTTQVSIAATYTLADEMKPWASVYELGIAFDGKVIETHPTVNGGVVQIAATGWCDAASAALSKHTIQLQAHLPFAPPVAVAASTLDFTCPPPSINTPPNDPATPPTGNASSSSGASGTSGSSGIDDPHQPRRTTVNGCTTSTAMASGAPASLASVGLLLGLALLVRRRISGASAASRRT